jgi:hypothetical protein
MANKGAGARESRVYKIDMMIFIMQKNIVNNRWSPVYK